MEWILSDIMKLLLLSLGFWVLFFSFFFFDNGILVITRIPLFLGNDAEV